ncbi:hypothetical protein Enr13x_28680 [Stieleria neptunia]|uniref:Uncharacterized protein n=1 Tax=Stieleria neptunia TaxID=2527979 RepID=A0A518HQ88_9BACT|nr:hypothetical protein [Stieleria neptunia]QDV43016.1 hypothetical protein Enr13x_28680 [Stieleria neptunia]
MISPGHTFDAESDSKFEAFHAPRGHCERLIHPPIDGAAAMMVENQTRAAAYPIEIASLRQPARDQLLRDARRYTSAYRDIGFVGSADQTIVMAGHQPTLFHPGVWFKNFALDRVGKLSGSVAVNLVVDSDVAGPSSLRVPHINGDTGSVGFNAVAFDRRGGGVPYEQSLVEDRELFDVFDRNVAETVAGIVENPLIPTLWQHSRDAINRCGYAGCALAQGRHRLEADLGLQTLEIPQSVVCRGEAFASFAMQILRDLPRFHDCYNAAAEFYRAAHGIRSKAHPVPNLGRDGDWLEAPFWVYGNQSPKRRSVWVRVSAAGSAMEISDRDKRQRKIDAADQPAAADAFLALASPEFKIRSRALITTMYARMVLSDLFLHGIGGGKYDQLGDLISRAFWNVDPPSFMVMSSTVLLPGHQRYPSAAVDEAIRQRNRQLRDLDFQPERYAERGDIDPKWITAKRELLAAIPPKGQRRGWHGEITALNQKMASRLAALRQTLEEEKSELQQRRREAAIWNSREHSFCIYPLDYLMESYEQMLG